MFNIKFVKRKFCDFCFDRMFDSGVDLGIIRDILQ